MGNSPTSSQGTELRLPLCSMGVLLLVSCLSAVPAFSQERPSGCGLSNTFHQVLGHGEQLGKGIEHAPRNAVRPENLKWELPIAAAAGLLIAEGDQPAADRIQSRSFRRTASQWSNVGLGMEIGGSALAWAAGCIARDASLRDSGLTALTAIGAATGLNHLAKMAFNRQYPLSPSSNGEFWEGGRSFPSGHAAASWAFASAIAHRYPHKRWLDIGVYGLAAGVALSRYPAKHHYMSDILVGSTLGYVTGTYVAQH